MRKMWLIARREYVFNFKRRSYLFTVFGVPIFTIAMMFLIGALSESAFTATGTLGNIGYVDHSGLLADPVEVPEEYSAFADEAAANNALAAGEIGAYFVVREDYMRTGQVDAYATEGIPDGIEDQLSEFLEANVARLVPENIPVERLLNPLGENTVVFMDTGEEVRDENGFLALFFKPYIFVLVFLMAVMTTAQFLMSGVVEEKENRMMEILVTSSTPLQMLWGKVLGLGALGLTQILIWIAGGAIFLNLNIGGDEGFLAAFSSMQFSAEYVLTGLLYFFFGYFLYAAIMAGIGAAVTAEQEARQIAGVFSLVIVLPMILSFSFLEDPNGTLPVILTLVPLTAPIAIVARMPLAPVPGWQLVLSIVILLLTTLVAVWLAARVFRLGMLMYGKRLTVREIIRAMRQGRRTMTTVAGGEGS